MIHSDNREKDVETDARYFCPEYRNGNKISDVRPTRRGLLSVAKRERTVWS